MSVQRITVKYFLEEPVRVSAAELVPIFHQWIQQGTVGGILIDVADYQHVPSGPGVMLVGHDVDYALDGGGGRPGLLLRRKRLGDTGGSTRDHLRTALEQALLACQALEGHPALRGRIAFRTDQVEITYPDRLQAPNTPAAFAGHVEDVIEVVAERYPGLPSAVEAGPRDPRQPLTFQIKVPGAPRPGDLLAQAGASATRLGQQSQPTPQPAQ